MPLLGHLSHSAERETEEKEEEAEPSAWHRILGPYCLLWSSSTSQASPGPWRGDASRPQSSLRGVDFLPTVTFPRGLCLLVAAPLLPAMAGGAGAGVWKPGPASPPGAPRQGLEQTSDSPGARADPGFVRSGRHQPGQSTRLAASLGPPSAAWLPTPRRGPGSASAQ